jgi:hypothetical protein
MRNAEGASIGGSRSAFRIDEMSHQKISVSVADGVATIELSDPPANTYSYEMMLEIDTAVLAARMDPNVHVISMRNAECRMPKKLQSAAVPHSAFRISH